MSANCVGVRHEIDFENDGYSNFSKEKFKSK